MKNLERKKKQKVKQSAYMRRSRRINVSVLLDNLWNDKNSVSKALQRSTKDERNIEEGKKRNSVPITVIRKNQETGRFLIVCEDNNY